MSGLIDIGKVFELRPLVFERPEETFHDGIVVATAGATHGAGDVEHSQRLLIVVAGGLRASIAVMQQAGGVGPSGFDGVTQCGADQWSGEAFRDGPADDLPTEQVQHGGQIAPAELCRQAGNISDPLLVGSVCGEGLIQKVGAGIFAGSDTVVVGVNFFETRFFRPISRMGEATVFRALFLRGSLSTLTPNTTFGSNPADR